MDQNFFFRWVWRFNALALAAALILVGLAIVPLSRGYSAFETIETVQDSKLPAVAYSLEMVRVIDGTGTVLFSYGSKPDFRGGGSFSPPAYKRVVNYLFYNSKDGSARWLLPGNDQLITAVAYVTDDGEASDISDLPPRVPSSGVIGSKANRTVRAAVFDVIPKRDHPDGKGTYQVFASRGDGMQVTKLIDGADEVTTFTALDPATIIVTHRHDGHTLATTFSVTDFKPIIEKDLEAFVPK